MALITIGTYLVGRRRPLAIEAATSWFEGESTKFACSVLNRSWFGDTTVSGLALLELPPWPHRLRHPRWDRGAQQTEIVPYGDDVATIVKSGIKLSKREERTFRGELRAKDRSGRVDLSKRTRLQAQAGSKRSRRRKVEMLQLAPRE